MLALLARQSGLHERALSACPEHLKPSFSSAQQDRLSQQSTQGQQYILGGKRIIKTTGQHAVLLAGWPMVVFMRTCR